MRKLLLASAAVMSVLWLAIIAIQMPKPGEAVAGLLSSEASASGYGLNAGVVAQHR